MQPRTYPPGIVRALLPTEHVTPATREVLRSRLEPGGGSPPPPRFFDAREVATLRAACDRLLPQTDRPRPVDLAVAIDERLADGKGDGWRYADLPPDGDAYRRGLRGLDEGALARFGSAFASLDGSHQDEILEAVQRGEASGETWETLPSRRFFEELLAELCECYYSDPLSQEEIGYVGMADVPGWQAIGLDQLDPREPPALDEPHG